MKLPETFRADKEHIEKLIEKAVVDKTLAKDLGKQVKEHLEQEALADKIQVHFKRKLSYDDLEDHLRYSEEDKKGPTYDTDGNLKNKAKKIFKLYPKTEDLAEHELANVADKLLDLHPNLKDEDVFISGYSLSVITDDVAYEVRYDTVYAYEGDIDKVDKGEFVEETIPMYRDMNGVIHYAKFNKEDNKLIVQALKDSGYKTSVHVIKEKKE